MARTFRATLEIATQGQSTFGKVPLDATIVEELGLRPGESIRAELRGTDFLGKVHGSMHAPSLLIPLDVLSAHGLREGQGVRLAILGRP